MFKIILFLIGISSIIFGLLLFFLPNIIFFNINNEIYFYTSIRILGASIFSIQGLGSISVSLKANRKIYLYRAVMYTTFFEMLALLYSRIINSPLIFSRSCCDFI